MDLFEVQNSIAVPSTHALLIEPFKSIWDRDQTPHKQQAIKEYTYIELLCSAKKSNPYAGYPESIRAQKVSNNIFPEMREWLPDMVVLEAIKMYKALQEEASPTLRLVQSAKKAVFELEKFLTDADLTERTNGGAAVFKPVDIANAVRQLPEMQNSLQKMEEKVQQELYDSSKTRGQREINAFEDPDQEMEQ